MIPTILIVEDNPAESVSLSLLLNENGYHSVQVAPDFEKAKQILLEKRTDLALLDIDLGEGKSGIEVAKLIGEENPIPFLFITGVADDAVINQATHTLPACYIHKPYSSEHLLFNLKLAHYKLNKHQEKPEVVSFKSGRDVVIISVEEIVAATAVDNYSMIIKKEGKVLVKGYLSETLEALNGHLLQIHRSHAVCLASIQSYKGTSVVINGKNFPLSRKYRPEFIKQIRQFTTNHL